MLFFAFPAAPAQFRQGFAIKPFVEFESAWDNFQLGGPRQLFMPGHNRRAKFLPA
jgi:hypothetical protein